MIWYLYFYFLFVCLVFLALAPLCIHDYKAMHRRSRLWRLRSIVGRGSTNEEVTVFEFYILTGLGKVLAFRSVHRVNVRTGHDSREIVFLNQETLKRSDLTKDFRN